MREGGRTSVRTTDEMLSELGRTVPGTRRNIVNTEVRGLVCSVVWCGGIVLWCSVVV